MNVGIIGGGWAGLAAAVALHDAGCQVHVYEAAEQRGGRARGVSRPGFPVTIDNGQHILLGAYTETLKLMVRLEQDPGKRFLRMPLKLKSADGQFELRCRNLPSPLHAAAGVLLAKGWPMCEKVSLTLAMLRLKRNGWKVVPDQTVTQWLQTNQQSSKVIRQFWEPLCLAALNTPIEEASADMLARVLGDSLDAGKQSSDALIPTTDLSDLWAAHLPSGIKIHHGSVIRRITPSAQGYCLDDQAKYDALVIATSSASAQRLLATLPALTEALPLLNDLQAFSPVPIATLTLALEKPWFELPEPMMMMNDSNNPGALGQWLFNHAHIAAKPDRQKILSVVISDCRALMQMDRDNAMSGLIQQLQNQTRRFGVMPTLIAKSLIIEKRATFAATPGLHRPANATPWPGLVLAGDWTDTGYPAVLEGAVRSGFSAAQALLKQ